MAPKVNDFYRRHRGPYVLLVARMDDDGELSSTWTTSPIEKGKDVEPRAKALLDDKRDTVVSVSAWSEREEQFVTSFR